MPRVTHRTLTDAQVKALAPGRKLRDIRDGSQRGLVLTILPSGRKQWTVRYRIAGKQRRLVLGEYPGLTLSRARDEEAEDARNRIRKGADPAAERRSAKAPAEDTVGALADHYLQKHARQFKRSAAEDERALSVDVLPSWKDRRVKELTRRDVRMLVERIADRGSPVMANRVLALVRKMLNFAVDHDWIEANPASRLAKPAREVSRERVLDDDEYGDSGGFSSTSLLRRSARHRAESVRAPTPSNRCVLSDPRWRPY